MPRLLQTRQICDNLIGKCSRNLLLIEIHSRLIVFDVMPDDKEAVEDSFVKLREARAKLKRIDGDAGEIQK